MSPDESQPRRVRVTSPRSAPPRSRRLDASAEIDAQTRVGELYMSTLLRAQLRLAGTVLTGLLVLVFALPVAYAVFPQLDGVMVLGMPLAWVVLGFAAYPVLVALGWLYVRAAERNERDFADVVERS